MVVGLIRGSVIKRNLCQLFAPSISADSYIDLSMDLSPDIKYSVFTPVHLQQHRTSRAISDVHFTFSHLKAGSPKNAIRTFIWPVRYSVNIRRNRVPEMTTEVRAGTYIMAFQRPFALTIFPSIITAYSSGNGIRSAQVKTVYSRLFKQAVWKTLSVRSF